MKIKIFIDYDIEEHEFKLMTFKECAETPFFEERYGYYYDAQITANVLKSFLEALDGNHEVKIELS